jgi:hypothetical protein
MPALNRAIPLPQMHNMAMLIGKYLHFDMARAKYSALNNKFARAESVLGFRLSQANGIF